MGGGVLVVFAGFVFVGGGMLAELLDLLLSACLFFLFFFDAAAAFVLAEAFLSCASFTLANVSALGQVLGGSGVPYISRLLVIVREKENKEREEGRSALGMICVAVSQYRCE